MPRLHINEPGIRIVHVPGVAWPIRCSAHHLRAIRRVVVGRDDVALFIGLRERRALRIGVDVGDLARVGESTQCEPEAGNRKNDLEVFRPTASLPERWLIVQLWCMQAIKAPLRLD